MEDLGNSDDGEGEHTILLHSQDDEVVPFEDSEELTSNSGLPMESLVEVGFEHCLADEESLMVMLDAVEARN